MSLVPVCLDALREQGLDTLRVVAVVDEIPPGARASWPARYPWVDFVFSDRPLTAGGSRNVVLERMSTRFAALLDADVVGEPGWLHRCCARLQETGAAVVVPTIIYPKGIVHAAGNMEYPNHVDGVTYLHKEHRFWGMPYGTEIDLPSVEVDYAEFHCLVCDVEAVRAAKGFDDDLVEFGEVDLGRRVRATGREVWVEPRAVVHSNQDSLIEVEDVALFARRWDRDAIACSRQHFFDTWGVDVGEEGGFDEFVSAYNSRLGPLPRHYPREWTLKLDRKVHGLAIRVRRIMRRTSRAVRPVVGVS